MTALPLIFGFRDALSGNGFLAGVAINGRALMVEEGENDWWMYGVQPGGICAGGSTFNEAHSAFREMYRKALFDMAGLCEDFTSFEAEVRRFCSETDDEDAARWLEAAHAIRKGDLDPGASAAGLPRVKAEEHVCRSTVARLDEPQVRFRPEDNEIDTVAVVAEAA